MTLAVLLGIAVRLVHVLRAGFPIHDGGLFYAMVESLKANHLRLPETITWSHYEIPFAYPPLGFYLTAALGLVTNLTTIDLLRLIPLVASALAVVAFAFLARTVLDNRVGEVVAVAVFAMAPDAYMWSLAGGGITRAPAQCFAFLALGFLILQLRAPSRTRLVAATFCCALTVLSHPEIAQLLAVTSASVALMYGRSKRGMLSVAYIGIGTAVLSAPWWLLVGDRYGLEAFLEPGRGATAVASVGAAELGLLPILNQLQHALSFAPVLGVALAWAIYRRNLGLALLVAACLVTRNIVFNGWPGLALAIGGFSGALHLHSTMRLFRIAAPAPAVLAVVAGAALTLQPLPVLPDGERDAMAWIAANTAPSATVLVFPEQEAWLDPTSDWFAALARRTGYGPPQGSEWLGTFEDEQDAYFRLGACRDTACVSRWADDRGIAFEYLYVPRDAPLEPEYQLVHETDAARVFLIRGADVRE